MTTLVIVESPGKVRTISEALGKGYKVAASVGHVRDLPANEIGMAPPDFVLKYVPSERGAKILSNLKQEVSKASEVILATDPDREGEAIAWHLADALKLKNPGRVTFTAITKKAIEAAVAAPRTIDMHLVHAQEARRALDRIVGYRVSPALSQQAGQALSAGRVQSPAVRLIVDRERAIESFVSVEHFGAELIFESDNLDWKAQWVITELFLPAGEKYFLDSKIAEQVAAMRKMTVSEFEEGKRERSPAAPFTTSTLQQAAGQRLKLKPKQTMQIAQKLYEQGAITYHRTDAPNMDAAGEADIANYAKSAGLPLADKPRTWKAKEGAQEGHEAIRPTQTSRLEYDGTSAEKALYQLIWQRAVASQLANAVYSVRKVQLNGVLNEQSPVIFRATGSTLVSPGWLTVYADSDEEKPDKDNDNDSNPIPFLTVGTNLVAKDGRVLNKKTKPPTRFTQATLVAEMEKLGIGRPSTYAAIIENILGRNYITEDKKHYLQPSDLGKHVRDTLVGKFQFAELSYTKELEEKLDKIAEGKEQFLPIISAEWENLDEELEKLSIEIAKLPIENPCPSCGKALARRKGKYGFFWPCTGYPDCNVTLPDNNGSPGERKVSEPTGFKCSSCGKELARRKGVSKPRKKGDKGRPYDFYGCTGFPKCDATFQTDSDGKPKLN